MQIRNVCNGEVVHSIPYETILSWHGTASNFTINLQDGRSISFPSNESITVGSDLRRQCTKAIALREARDTSEGSSVRASSDSLSISSFSSSARSVEEIDVDLE